MVSINGQRTPMTASEPYMVQQWKLCSTPAGPSPEQPANVVSESVQQQQEQQPSQLINPSRRSLMMVVPLMAAAGAAAAAAPGAQAADDLTSLNDTCLECAGIGIVPCKYAGVLMLWFCIMAGLQALCGTVRTVRPACAHHACTLHGA